MATNNISDVILLATTTAIILPFAYFFCKLVLWLLGAAWDVVCWILGWRWERLAQKLVSDRDGVVGQALPVGPVNNSRIRKNNRKAIAVELADVALFKFGRLSYDESNKIVVRKYLRDQMEKTSLRFRDRNHILELATMMFFVPTEDQKELEMVETTVTYRKAVSKISTGVF